MKHRWILVALVLLFLMLPACSRKSDEPSMFTGVVVSSQQIRAEEKMTYAHGQFFPVIIGSTHYAVINREWVFWYYAQFRDDISKGFYGVVKWEDVNNCVAFTMEFVAGARKHFVRNVWNNDISRLAKSYAIAEYWYTPNGAPTAHSIVQIRTQNGIEYFEPQTGKFVTLTDAEKASAYLRKYN